MYVFHGRKFIINTLNANQLSSSEFVDCVYMPAHTRAEYTQKNKLEEQKIHLLSSLVLLLCLDLSSVICTYTMDYVSWHRLFPLLALQCHFRRQCSCSPSCRMVTLAAPISQSCSEDYVAWHMLTILTHTAHSASCAVGICVKEEILSGLLSDVIFIHWLCSLASDSQILFFLPNILIVLFHWKGQFTSS